MGGGIISEAALAPLRPDAVSLMTLDLVIKCHDEVSRTFEYVICNAMQYAMSSAPPSPLYNYFK